MVNIKDFNNRVHSSDITQSIFDRQRELMAKYEGIEEKNGLLETHDVPVDINSYKGQARLKNFAWRVTEELTEAMEPLYLSRGEIKPGTDQYIHMMEEYIDALHFLTELAILSGIEHEDYYSHLLVIDSKESQSENLILVTTAVIMSVGLAMNCLKNKPWKQTPVTTDEKKYKDHIKRAMMKLASLLYYFFGLKGDDLLNCYLNKADVNKFRQESGY